MPPKIFFGKAVSAGVAASNELAWIHSVLVSISQVLYILVGAFLLSHNFHRVRLVLTGVEVVSTWLHHACSCPVILSVAYTEFHLAFPIMGLLTSQTPDSQSMTEKSEGSSEQHARLLA